MSTIHAGFYEHLSSQMGIARYVGTRINKAGSPAAATYPRITYQRISSQHEQHYTAASGLAMATFQINVFDTDGTRCDEVAEAVRNAMQGLTHNTKWGPHGEFRTCGVFLKGQQDLSVPPSSNSEQLKYHVAMDFDVHYQESVPTFA